MSSFLRWTLSRSPWFLVDVAMNEGGSATFLSFVNSACVSVSAIVFSLKTKEESDKGQGAGTQLLGD